VSGTPYPVTASFSFSYNAVEKAEAVFSALEVDNQDFNRSAGEELVSGRVEGATLFLSVKGSSISSFRATVDDLFRALSTAEKVIEN
jgi:tRNA threonylcarbamoyladenosine modification (KEOPS) complex  Pcc1 subunit